MLGAGHTWAVAIDYRHPVGRDAELEAIAVFLDRVERAAAALVFEGEAGIGKTTVWGRILDAAPTRGFAVLACRPAEAETKLAFASLADLLEPVADGILPLLPPPQRLALEVALLRVSPAGPAPSARAVGMAVLSALRLLAERAPVVVAIDDQQWLDRASAHALAFALRRIHDRRVGVAATARVEGHASEALAGRRCGESDPLGLADAFAGRLERVVIGPLELGGLYHVLRSHLGHVFPRPTLRRITEASGGNPFFALEYARAWLDAGPARAGDPLPVPDNVAGLVQRRLGRLPARVRRLLLTASATAAPTVDLLRVAEGTDPATALGRAVQAGMIHIRDREIRFAHPLFASAVYSSADSETRREIHGRLANVAASPEERARHLAIAATGPDEDVARTLDHASFLARSRGAPDAAGELQELAADLTPIDDVHGCRRRRTAAAEHYFHAGDRARARTLLAAVLADPIVGDERAGALHLLGQIRMQEDSFGDAVGHLTEAEQHAERPALRVAIRGDLLFATFSVGDLARALALGHQALAEAERIAEPGLIAEVLGLVVVSEYVAGRGCDLAGMERALALEDQSRDVQLFRRPVSMAGILAVFDGRLAEGDRLLRRQCEWAIERGEESELPFLLISRARLEWWRGDFAATARCAEGAITLSLQTGNDTMRLTGHLWRAAARGGSGDVAGARADVEATRALIDRTGYVQSEVFLRMNEAALELSLGDAAAVERALAPLVMVIEGSIAGGLVDEAVSFGVPGAAYVLPDAIEALLDQGQVPRAAALLEWLAPRAERLGPWAGAGVARCRALLAAAQGALDAAVDAAEQAVSRWRPLEMPIELGRALVTLGRVRRRRGERRLAREACTEAAAIFRRHAAMLWARRADEELARIPIRRHAGTDLTPTEERVAALAATGQTNQQVSRALFMSPKTVEANLTRIYGKLGIRSRAELGARMSERQARK
jgi:DNA-binding CsgD family transcriptional regulator